MKRKIYKELIDWKNGGMNKPLMVIGARQIGKTYTIQEFCNAEFENNIYINLLDQHEIVEIFKAPISTEEKFNKMKLELGIDIDIDKTIIFFDEIQESEELISSLKFFNESSKPYKIITAGSLLGVKLKRMHTSFPVGKVKMINMYPMDFEEYLMANGNEELIEEIKNCYSNNTPMISVLHEKSLDLFRSYLCCGGMPEAVKNLIEQNGNVLKFDKTILTDIKNSYLDDMNRYVNNKAEATKIEAIYKSIPAQIRESK